MQNRLKFFKTLCLMLSVIMLLIAFSYSLVSAAYPGWEAWTAYKTGDIVSYQGNNYICVQGHTALPGWEPPLVPALWTIYGGGEIEKVATPVFSPSGGTYTAEQNVNITSSTTGSTIHYTLDGTEPTEASTVYTTTIKISGTTTIKARAFKAGMNGSDTASATYTINSSNTTAVPAFSPAGGTYNNSQNVKLTCSTNGAVIRYTTDGSVPNSSSTIYSGAISVAAATTIKAYASAAGMADSAVTSATYNILPNQTNLPAHILTGYWQNFDNGAKCLKIADVPDSYNIIAVAFADAAANPGAVTFTLDSGLSSKLGGYTEQQFIQDIAAVKARGQKVIISVGGERGSVSVASDTAATNFADSVYSLMTKYGFDGVDIDLENGINPTYMTSALRKLSAKAGSNLIITMAPQTIDMQSTSAGYFQVALNIKDILTVVNTQYYNSGTMLGQDGKVYGQGSVDFLTALAAIQLENGLRPDQVGLGLPASRLGAGSGYVDPSVVNSALDCLAAGTNGGTYKPPRTYPAIRGAMTWSINWDASNNYNFANTVSPKLKSLP